MTLIDVRKSNIIGRIHNKVKRAFFGALLINILTHLFVFFAPQGYAADTFGLSFSSVGGAVSLEAAIEEGYFREEGIEVKPVKAEPDEIPGLLNASKIVGGELDYRIYQLADKGVGVTAGLYSGFLLLVGQDPSEKEAIKLVSIHPASGPAVAAARELKSKGIDLEKVTWLEASEDKFPELLEKGDATLAALFEKVKAGTPKSDKAHNHAEHGDTGHSHGHGSDTGDSLWQGKIKVVYSARANLPKDTDHSANPHAKHTAAHHFFESFVFVGKDFYDKEPDKAAAITRAWIRGAIWVGENKERAADLALSKSLFEGSREELIAELDSYMWMPGVKHAKEHLRSYVHEWIGRGLFPKGTDESKLFQSLFIQALPDVN
jgi:NitT/TauT family transport system substrate-binding protein